MGAGPGTRAGRDALPKPSEEACLDEVMRLRFGTAPCKACGQASGHVRELRQRAYSCRACGLKVFPCHGTPFARPDPPLAHWFLAVHLAAIGEGRRTARVLNVSAAAARRLAAGVAELRGGSSAAKGDDARLLDGITAFMRARAAAAPDALPARPPADRETLWETVRATVSGLELERRPVLGLAAIGAFMLGGAGLGWLMVPAPDEPETELAQATAILTLGEERPVIVVTPDVAAQLYDVTDADAVAASPLASSIRVASNLDRAGSVPLTSTRPMTAPPIKLSAGLGKSLAEGDTRGARERASDRPDLAAYNALASEIEGTGPRNPDELLTFGPMHIRRYLVEKIVRAARETSTDPVLLMAIADKESSFQTEVQAKTSSASGLFQFIERTWFDVVREFGPAHGLEKEAQAVVAGPDAAARLRILDLRRDAYLSAVLAAEMLKRDSQRIARRIGRNLTGGEVYLVHFLGAEGAERFLDQVDRKPETVAADLLPKPAAANRTIFYSPGSSGESKGLSVAEVRGKFETMISLRLDRYKSVKGAKPAPGGG